MIPTATTRQPKSSAKRQPPAPDTRQSGPPATKRQPTSPAHRRQPTQPASIRQPTQPAHRRQPTQPAHRRQPTSPAHRRQPTQPASIRQPTQPDHRRQPTHPAHRRQPTHPAHRRQPTHPAHRRQPTHPAHKRQPTHPAHRRQPTHPAHRRQPTTPAHRRQPTFPAHRRQPTLPAHRRQPTSPAHRRQPTYPANTWQPTPPANERQPTSPARIRQHITPANKRQPTCRTKERQLPQHRKWQPAPEEGENKEWKPKKATQKPNNQNKTKDPQPCDEEPITHLTLMANQQDANETPTHEGEYKKEIHNKQRKKHRPRIRKNKEITIATINVRGIKGKIKSLETTLNTEKISIALITETQLKKNEQISIKGYRWIHKPRPNNNGGGVGILVAEKIAQNTTEDNSGEDHDQVETKWIKLECRPKNIAIGVFYGPQENEKIEKVKEIYTALNNQIAQKAQTNEIIIAGDYNAKLLIDTDNHKQSESRNGKLLKDLIANNNLPQST